MSCLCTGMLQYHKYMLQEDSDLHRVEHEYDSKHQNLKTDT